MSAIRLVLICALAVVCFSQLVLSRPDGAAEGEGALKSVEAKLSVAVDDLRKAISDVFQNVTDAIQTEINKNPEASQLYKNMTESLSGIAKQMRDAVSAVTPAPA